MGDYISRMIEERNNNSNSNMTDTNGTIVGKVLQFENASVLITDPCYIINHDNDNDWRKCDYGRHMNYLGISQYTTNHTIYGDWSCTVFENKTNRVLGQFCADSGEVGVFDLDEVLKYNPKFAERIAKSPFLATVIPNFTGKVWLADFKLKGNPDPVRRVVGEGNVCFISKQTGL